MPRSNTELFEEAERQLIGEAVAETEQEIADSAFGDDPDENTGDNSLEQIDEDDVPDENDLGDDEGDGEPEQSEEADADADDGGDAEHGRDDRPPDRQDDTGRVPSRVVREANEARRAAEAERDAERARVRELDARLRLIEQNRKPEQRQGQQDQQEPDIFADPEAWKGKVRADIRQDMLQATLQTGIETAAEEHGEAFNTAYQGLIQGCQSGDPVALATAQRIARAPQLVGKIAIGYHRQQEMLREIGSDPDAFIDRKVQERLNDPQFRRQAISGLREDAMRGDGNGPRTRTRLPPSLNSASGGTSHRGRDTARTSRTVEQDIFDSAFDD